VTTSEETRLVTLEEIEEAHRRLVGVALRTPLLPFRENALVKAENLQPTGSFKIRGAYNTLAQIAAEGRVAGVVAHSSGNHGQAVARAARLLALRAVVVMPDNAPRVKVDGVRADGAEVVFVGPHNEERVARAHEIAHDEGLELVSSANDARVVAGQGTIGLEIVEQLIEMQSGEPPVVLAPIGLGGMSAGIATAIKSLPAWSGRTGTVIGVEPALAADARDSLAAGERRPWDPALTGRTIADGLRAEAPAPIPFAHLLANLDGMIVVEEEEIAQAVAIAARELRLVLEPSGAVTLAAICFHADELPDGQPIAIASGGNVDPDRFMEYLTAPA
jgi:threonine dehydratase